MFEDSLSWPDGLAGLEVVVEGPSASFIVPVFDDGSTVLVGQWRHAWDAWSWEVPAGRLDGDEDPLEAARRELREEAGLEAAAWTELGLIHGWAAGAVDAHLFLARDLAEVGRALEPYERDMEMRRLPLAQALDVALGGEMLHASSISALCRAARALSLI